MVRSSAGTQLPSGCLYSGRWHTDGSIVTTREECLRCTCLHGALSCRRRACAPLPDPLPHRCHVRHRRGSCCPELHCPGEHCVSIITRTMKSKFKEGPFRFRSQHRNGGWKWAKLYLRSTKLLVLSQITPIVLWLLPTTDFFYYGSMSSVTPSVIMFYSLHYHLKFLIFTS